MTEDALIELAEHNLKKGVPGADAILEHVTKHRDSPSSIMVYAISQLDPMEKLILKQRFEEGRTSAEIGKAMGAKGVQIGTRARCALRKVLAVIGTYIITGDVVEPDLHVEMNYLKIARKANGIAEDVKKYKLKKDPVYDRPRCVFDIDVAKCSALTFKNCDGCKFYKSSLKYILTHEHYTEDIQKLAEMRKPMIHL